jgi:hypothetical protein
VSSAIRSPQNSSVQIQNASSNPQFKIPPTGSIKLDGNRKSSLPPVRKLVGEDWPGWTLDMVPGVSTAEKLDAIERTDPGVRNYEITSIELGRGHHQGRFTVVAANPFVEITFEKGKHPKIKYFPQGIAEIQNARIRRGEPAFRKGDLTDPAWRAAIEHPKPVPLRAVAYPTL